MEEKREGGALNYEISSSIYRLKLAQRRDPQGFSVAMLGPLRGSMTA